MKAPKILIVDDEPDRAGLVARLLVEQGALPLQAALRWTTTKPTEAGYYWVRAPKLSTRVDLFYHAHGQPWLTSGYINLEISYGSPVEYAGPIPRPT